MSILDFKSSESLGKIISVDTATVTVRVDELELLKRIQVNRLTAIRSSKAGQHLIGIVSRITRKADAQAGDESDDDDPEAALPENNLVRVALIGTLCDKDGLRENVFKRTLETVPEIDADCFSLEGQRLTAFMQIISQVSDDGPQLNLGRYALDEDAKALLNGNRLFQRHAVVVGSTGSGKSFTTARLLDQIAELPQANAILFDIHGEYKTLNSEDFRHLRIAGPSEIGQACGFEDGVLHLPFWLLGYEALIALFVDRTDLNAPNQAMLMTRCVTEAKRAKLDPTLHSDILANFTIDSPVPFDIDNVHLNLTKLNEEMVPGANNRDKQGPYFDKLSRLIARFEAKRNDRRLGFIFQPPPACMEMDWLAQVTHFLTGGRGSQQDGKGGIKIINFSEVPSDILPLMVSLIARLVFTVSQWTPVEARHPIALFCDEAHLYIPERTLSDAADEISVDIFERIAKEGRKYGIGLVVISQRPSEVNRTVLSQCNNVIAMRLTNGDDQSVIKRLLPDSLGGFGDLLPVLDIGEALVVGDASLLPTRVVVSEPRFKPSSATVDFWDRWREAAPVNGTDDAVRSWRRQSNQ
ncbi:ATP-binding protein [Mongoliimonas terrestris]|uniref:ATP-binding protein n=1 Tax=Mongoliimonas terrestris TaxID=1709001 RepID=UPI0009497B23|nr:ATP-binding protein [Mongoliimonas terrestris]